MSALASQDARWQGLGAEGRSTRSRSCGIKGYGYHFEGRMGLPGVGRVPGSAHSARLRHHQIGQTPKRVSCRNIVVCCRVPWIFLVLCSLLCSRPHSSRGLLQTLLFNEASRCFCTAGPPWRGQSQADTCPVLPPVSVGASGRKSVHFEKLRDSAVRKAGLAPARSVPCHGSDLHRPPIV